MFHLTQKGSPHEKGLAHGRTFAREIRELVSIRTRLASKYFTGTADWRKQAKIPEQIEVLKCYPSLYEEFKGIAEGAVISESDLFILNNYTDLRDFGGAGDCSVFAVFTEAEAFCGQTWDMHASAKNYMLQLYDKDNHCQILTVTGCLALSGVNRNGVSVLINNMHCRETSVGLMWPALVRNFLLHSNAKEASEFCHKQLPSSGHNYLLVDPQAAYNIETTGKRFEITNSCIAQQGLSFHTNHYVGSLKATEILSRQSKTTHVRYAELENYFSQNKSITPQKVAHDILDGAICRSVCIREAKSEHASATCGGLILNLKSGESEMFKGAYSEAPRYAFNWRTL